MSAIPHAYTTSVTAYKKHHTQGAATAAYVLRYVIFPKNSTIYHEHTKYIRLRTLVIPRGLMKRGELLIQCRIESRIESRIKKYTATTGKKQSVQLKPLRAPGRSHLALTFSVWLIIQHTKVPK